MNVRNLIVAVATFAAVAGVHAQTTPASAPAREQANTEQLQATRGKGSALENEGGSALRQASTATREPAAANGGVTREQVMAEFFRARANGEIAVTEPDNDVGSAVSRARERHLAN